MLAIPLVDNGFSVSIRYQNVSCFCRLSMHAQVAPFKDRKTFLVVRGDDGWLHVVNGSAVSPAVALMRQR